VVRSLRTLTCALGVLVGLAVPGVAQAAPTELFFSEYIEGSSNNKALEIYNGTSAPIDLGAQGYNVQMFFNGAATAGLTINLTGTVASGDVFVLAQSLANAAILAQADQTNGAGWFNGDDAVSLRKGTTVVDSVGQVGTDPGAEWGSGLTSTMDNTLRRKLLIESGDTTISDAFDPAVEWDGFATDTFRGLGAHPGLPPEPAPTVVNTTPVDGEANFGLNSPLSVQFSEPVNVSSSWYTLVCSSSGTKTATVTSNASSTLFALQPTTPFVGGESCTFTVVAAGVTDQDADDPYDAMLADVTVRFVTNDSDPCLRAITPIPAIQGSGSSAAVTGAVTTRGIVVGDYEGPSPAQRGFFLQAATGDGDAATSDGIFVFNGNADSVSLGDLVTVSGNASDFQDQTQVSATQVTVCGTGSVATTDVTLPVPSATYLERFEGMLVRMPQTLYVTEHFQLGRFGQVVMSSGDRLVQPTSVVAPGAPAIAMQAENNLNRLIVDDALQSQNPDPILFGRGGNPLTASNTLRGGDTATGMVGVLSYTWAGNSASGNAYRLRPVGALGGGVPSFVAANPRPSGSPAVGGSLKVVGMNLLNFFNSFGTTGCSFGVGGPVAECRGADDAGEFARQWPKTVKAIIGTGGDVIGIGEIENDGYGPTSAIQFLVDRLNEATAPGTYAFIDADAGTGQMNALGTDAIKVGLLYKPAKVTPIGQTAALNSVAFVNGGDGAPRNRPAIAQAFIDLNTGGRVVVSANHLKSKGSACDAPDSGDGQGNCAGVRTNAANLLADWLNGDPTGTGTDNVLIVGDLNSYAKENPIAALEAKSFTNLIASRIGSDAYSYVFDGQWGYLDYAFGNPAILSRVTGVAEWHVNADEPSVLDYNDDFKSPGQLVSLYAADEFRVSDHDPVVVGLNLPVTFDSLCVLTKLFVDSTDVEQSLCEKLADAKAAAASGKTKTKQNILDAYMKQVQGQSGKSMTTAEAAKLIELAKQL
jgi:predicted extracellular nuclease